MRDDMFDALRYAIPSLFKENCENRVADYYIPDLLEALDRCSIPCGDKCNGCPFNHLTLCGNLENIAKQVIEKLIEKKDTSSLGHVELTKLKETYNTLNVCGSHKYCPCSSNLPCPFTDDTCWTIDRDAHEAIDFLMKLPDKQNTQLQPQIYLNIARGNGKTLTQSELLFKSLTQEDYKQMTAIETAFEKVRKAIEREQIRQGVNKFFDIKSIEVSVDHRTVVVVWADGETTKVVRSENDPDDIYMAFTAALAKKLYGSNSAIKRTISKKMNQHKPKIKKED